MPDFKPFSNLLMLSFCIIPITANLWHLFSPAYSFLDFYVLVFICLIISIISAVFEYVIFKGSSHCRVIEIKMEMYDKKKKGKGRINHPERYNPEI